MMTWYRVLYLSLGFVLALSGPIVLPKLQEDPEAHVLRWPGYESPPGALAHFPGAEGELVVYQDSVEYLYPNGSAMWRVPIENIIDMKSPYTVLEIHVRGGRVYKAHALANFAGKVQDLIWELAEET